MAFTNYFTACRELETELENKTGQPQRYPFLSSMDLDEIEFYYHWLKDALATNYREG